MSVAKAVVGRPVTWLVVFVLLSITGIFLVSNISIEMYPEIEVPYIVVATTYIGADPETMEKSVTDILEAAIANTSGIVEMTSRSYSNFSMIILQFEFGADINEKINRVRDNVDRVISSLPDDVNPPIIMEIRPDDQPIMRIAVLGPPGSDLTQNDLRAIANNQLLDFIKQIEGVASCNVEGGQDAVIRIDISQNRLEAYGITIMEIARTIGAQNLELGAGYIEEGLIEYSIKTVGEFDNINQIANTVVMQKGGADIRLQDIAEVYFGYEDERSSVFVNGEPGVYISVMKQVGANTVKVANSVYRIINDLNKLYSGEIVLEITQDDTLQTRAMLNELINSGSLGILLAMLVLALFLRNVNGSIIVGLSIPLSFLIVLLCMSIAGISINTMTLAGLILGLGMTVDCAIVVIESVTAYREKGEKPTIAAILAGEEVMSSLIAGTLTMLCVFVPIILFKNQLELIGILVQDMVFTICVSVIVSLFIGILLSPVLASKWMPVHSRVQKPIKNPFVKNLDRLIDNSIKGVTSVYIKFLTLAMKHRFATCILIISSFIGAVLGMGKLEVTMMPKTYSDTVVLEIEMPLGTRYDDTVAVAMALQDIALREIVGYKNIITTAGNTGRMMSTAGVHNANVTVVLDLDDSNADNEEVVKSKLRAHFDDFPDAYLSFVSTGLEALVGGSDIDLKFTYGEVLDGMAKAENIKQLLEQYIPELQEIKIDMDQGLPQVNVNLDRDRAYNMGLNVVSVAMEITASMNNVRATTFKRDGVEYDVILQFAKEDRYEVPDLGRIFVRSSNGRLVPVSNFASLERTLGPVNINRETQVRTIHVTADVIEGYSVRGVEAKIAALLDEHDIKVIFSGASEQTAKIMRVFGMVIILALLLVFGVMAAQYESFIDPFINFCCIPLLLIGVVLIHILTESAMSSLTMMGIILLAGLVTSNGILLVDYTNHLRKKGMGMYEACIEAGSVRFRPVVMTAMTTMLGLAPMAFFPGKSSTVTSPIGLVVFGGLASATLITLFFIPVLYSLFHSRDKLEKINKK